MLPYLRVIDVAFLGDDTLYGITSGDELVAFHLGEDDDGRPQVTGFRLVIVNPMADYYKKHSWSWPAGDDDTTGERSEYDGGEKDGSNEEPKHEDEAPNQDKDGNDDEEEEEEDDEAAANPEEEGEADDEAEAADAEEQVVVVDYTSFDADDYEVREGDDDDWELRYLVPYEAKDETYTARYLVPSLSGDLLLVRHQRLLSPYSDSYTSKVEVLKADVMAGRWIPVTAHDGLGKGEALFLSRSFSKSVRAHGDVEEGLVHYLSSHLDDVLDTRSWTIRNMTFRWPRQRNRAYDKWETWLFPPELVL